MFADFFQAGDDGGLAGRAGEWDGDALQNVSADAGLVVPVCAEFEEDLSPLVEVQHVAEVLRVEAAAFGGDAGDVVGAELIAVAVKVGGLADLLLAVGVVEKHLAGFEHVGLAFL